MAMMAAANDFEPWLIEKLKELKIDEGVYGSYITGILEGDESTDEKKEALEGILSEIAVRYWIIFRHLTILLGTTGLDCSYFSYFLGQRC